MKALIVEDEYTSRTLLAELLAPYCVCEFARTGQEAMTMLENMLLSGDQYDLVCLDIMLPDFDGLEVLRRFRLLEKQNIADSKRQTTVFMTTALDDVNRIMDAFTLGQCQAYLMKPVNKNRLEQHVREFLFPH